MLLTAFVWGATFVTVKQAVAEIPTATFLALRFALAFVVLTPVFWREIVGGWRRLAFPSLVLGVFLWGGYTLQTLGLESTQASRAGFITGLVVVLVPLLSALIVREHPPIRALVGVALALAGLAFLFVVPSATAARPASSGLGAWTGPRQTVGDLLVLACTVCFALQVTLTGLYSPTRARNYREAAALATLQMGVAACLSLGFVAVGFVRGGARLAAVLSPGATGAHPFSASTAIAIVICGLFASAGALLAQTIAQRFTPPTHTALILGTEPVFAVLAGWLLLGERLGPWGLAGCLLILAGMLTAEIPLGRRMAARPGRRPAAR